MKDKIKGTIKKVGKQVGAALGGDAGILNTLEGEHTEVSTLMNAVISSDSPVAAAEKHYPTIRKKLLLHTQAEQQVLYTACERYPETAEMIPDSRAEHQEIEEIIGELDSMAVDAPAWMERFEALQQTVTEHIEDEEAVLFERCKKHFQKDELRELDDQFESTKQDLAPIIGEVSMYRTEEPRPSA